MSNETTFAEDIVKGHIEYCNNIVKGFKEVRSDLFSIPVGTVISTTCGYPKALIGIVFGGS